MSEYFCVGQSDVKSNRGLRAFALRPRFFLLVWNMFDVCRFWFVEFVLVVICAAPAADGVSLYGFDI
jgi:hypothetical protein